MVEVGGYYYLSAQEIESVFCVKGSADYPYKLTVIMKSGKDYSVCYEKETARNEEKRRVLNAIETERRRDAETILNKLYKQHWHRRPCHYGRGCHSRSGGHCGLHQGGAGT